MEKRLAFKTDVLDKYGTDLTQMALEDKLDPVIGRQQQLEHVIQVLCKRRKNNACLVGDPGVGKTVIAEALAQNIAKASVPLLLRDNKIYSIDMGRLIAGASNRGEFEERLIQLVDEVKQSNGVVLVFIDELHTLIGAGAGGQALDAANILKPALARGELRCIGATTIDEYNKYIEKDSALKRRFKVVKVPEPSVEETIEILKGLRTKYETHHSLQYTDKALTAAARLSKQYISDGFLPDKAIDLIDEAGSYVKNSNDQARNNPLVVTELSIQKIVAQLIGCKVYSDEESKRFLKMEELLGKRIIGQECAVKAVSRAIRRGSAGIKEPNRPLASFMLTGPTGVGKTQLAKVVAAEFFGSEEFMIRLDMSEYMESHSVSKILGSPPGYIGHDSGGHLTEAVHRKPHSLILFDEIEKAHRDIHNVMLQILDDGRLTDSKERTVDFSNTIIVMTSNIGGHLMNNSTSTSTSDHDDKVMQKQVGEELKKHFRPEFLNRLDEVIIFKRMNYLQLKQILNRMLEELYPRVEASKKIKLQVTECLKEKLAEEGYSPSYGARPLRRAITRLLEDRLAEGIINGDVKEGDLVTMDVDLMGQVIIY